MYIPVTFQPVGDVEEAKTTLKIIAVLLLGGLAVYGLARYGNPLKLFGKAAEAVVGSEGSAPTPPRRRRSAWAVELYRTARQPVCSGGAIYRSRRRAKTYQKRKQSKWYTELKRTVW